MATIEAKVATTKMKEKDEENKKKGKKRGKRGVEGENRQQQ